MSLQQPYIALDWVKDALDETLAQVQSALKKHSPQDLIDALSGLHQVSGTLHMAQLDDTLLLSETLEKLLENVISGRIAFLSTQQLINDSVALLVEELDQLQRTKNSRHVAIFAQVDLLNKPLSHSSADTESSADPYVLFKPDLSLLDEQFVVQPQSLEGQRKLSQAYQHFLALWLAGAEPESAVQGLARIAGLLQLHAQTKQQAALWQVADIFHQAIATHELTDVPALRSVLIRLERSLVQSADHANSDQEEILLGDLLQILDPKKISNPKVQQLRQLYGLELPNDQGTSRRLLDSALRQVINAREGLSVSRDTAAIALREAIRLLHVSGWTSLAAEAQAQLDGLLTHYVADEDVTNQLALALTAFSDQLQRTIDLTVLSSQGLEANDGLVQNARHAAVRESRAALEKTKSGLALYHQSRGDIEALEPLPELLALVRGAFEILGLSRAANLLSSFVAAILETVLVKSYKPHWKQVDLLAQLVSSIEYYLDQLAGHYQDERILDVAEKTLAEFKQPQAQAEPVPVGGAKLYHDETTLAMLGFVDEQGDTLFNQDDNVESAISAANNSLHTDIGAAVSHIAASNDQDFALDDIEAIPETSDVIGIDNPFHDDFEQDDEIRSIFIEEAHEVLDNITVYYPKWKVDFSHDAALKELRRAFHTLKGSGRMVGARTVGELGWSVESLLNRILDGQVAASNQVTQLIDDVRQVIPALVTSYTNKRFNTTAQIQQVLALVQRAEDIVSKRVVSAGKAADLVDDDEFALDEGIAVDPERASAESSETVITPTVGTPKQSVDFTKEYLPLTLLSSHAPQSIPSDDLVSYFGEDDAVREIFLEEAHEVLQEIGEKFPLWAVNFDDQPALEIIRRAFHTLKGSGRMVGAHVIGELAWSIERLLNSVRERTVAPNQSIVQLLGEVIAIIPELVDDFSAQRTPSINVLPIVQAAWLLRDGHALSSGQIQTAVLNAVDGASAGADEDSDSSATDFDQIAALLNDPEFEADALPPITASVATPQIHAKEIAHDELDPQLLEIFVTEAEGYLTDIQNFAMQAMSADSDQIMVSDLLLRALHTLRGSAGMTSIESIYQLAHVMEYEFKRLMRERIPVNDEHIDALIELVRLTHSQLSMLKSGQSNALDSQGYAFIEHVQAMNPHQDQRVDEEQSKPVFTGLVTELMDIGIEDVLDAEWTLKDHFAKPDTLSYIAIMHEQLEQLAAAVAHVPIVPLNDLVVELQKTYQHLHAHPAIVDAAPPTLIDDLLAAHATLTRMFDSLAASQEVQLDTAILDVLRDWQSKVEISVDAPIVQDISSDIPHDLGIVEATADAESESRTTAQLEYPIDHENDAELLEIFMEEAEELVQEIDESFSSWAADPSDSAPLKALQRHLHTLKGGARMGRVQSLGDYTHELETVYERLVEGRIQSSDVLVKFLRHAQDQVAQQVDQLGQTQQSFFTPTETETLQQYIKSSDVQVLQDYFDLLALIRLAGGQELKTTSTAPLAPAVVVEPEIEKPVVESVTPVQKTAQQKEWPKPVEPLASKPSMVASVVSAVASKVASVVRPQPVVPPVVAPVPEPLVSSVQEKNPLLGQMQVLAEAWDEGSAPDPEVLEIFLDEAAEIINQTSLQLTEWLALVTPELGKAQTREDPKSKSLLQVLQRNLHTFKGGARMAGVNALGDLSHEMEFVYEDLALGKTPVTVEIGQLLNQSHDWLADSVAVLDRGERPQAPQALIDALRLFRKNPASLVGAKIEVVPASLEEVSDAALVIDEPVQTLKASMTDHVITELNVNQEVSADLPPIEGAFPKLDSLDVSSAEMVRVSANLMDKMINLVGENAINRARIEMGLTGVAQIVDEMGATIKRIAEQLRRMDGELESQIIARHQEDLGSLSSGQYQDFDPLEMDQYSSINQLSKSLAESVSDLLDFKNTLVEKARDSESLLLQQSRIQSELQEGLMSSRLVPFSRLVPRLQRVVRQTATELGKSVNLVIQNAEGELDRSVLERMIAPLEHMLRNAVDHGLESVADRAKQQKAEKGTITLSVQREGSEVILTLQDDGAGIHVEAVRQRAVERGIISATAELTNHEIMQLIFHAGLSTAKQVTQISGRGVGMDVVQSEIRQLGGVVTVDSVEAVGTTFTLRLPLTVAVTDALRVRVGDRIFAISLSQIERIVRVSPDELAKFYSSQQELFSYADKPYRLRYLGELIGGQSAPTLYGQILPLPLLIVKYEGQQVAIQVDQLVGSREEMVIKPVGLQLASVSSISGATILGDGSVIIILDLAALARTAASQSRASSAAIREVVEAPLPAIQQKKVIMVVDDSVTVRKVTTRLLERQGYQVVQAKDGVDAMSKLEDVRPDLMLLDIEMPRMDGFEVANLVRHNPRLSELPIIMITSRTGEKHRERAFSAGVNGYMGKPFQEQILLENISELLAESSSTDTIA